MALVGTDGTIDWHCCPSFDSPSVFGSLLDADRGGSFELAAAVPAETRQFYLPDTNVLITRFFAEEGVGEIQLAIRRGLPADLERWRKTRDAIYRRIMDRGWSARLKAFTQYEGGDVLDASVLLMPLVKFISPTDPRWLSILAEEISRTGQQQGNFPQALTHLALISAAFNLNRALDSPTASAGRWP